MCNRNFHIDWIIFLHFTFFYLFWTKKYSALQRKYKYCSVLKILKNLELKIENALFLNWNFVFTIMIYNIVKEL